MLFFPSLLFFLCFSNLEGKEATTSPGRKDTDREHGRIVEDGLYEFHESHEEEFVNIRVLVKPEGRNEIKDPKRLWKDGIVPFRISDSYGSREKRTIFSAMGDIMSKTCIRFVPKKNDTNAFIFIKPGLSCSTALRKIFKGKLYLRKGCNDKGIVIHELMHVLGFHHEHNRHDRDDYVKINWENIKEDAYPNFKKFSEDLVQTANVSYDYGSIMNYSSNSFSKNRSIPTIITRKKNVAIGQRKGLSESDILKILKLYNCKMNTKARSKNSATSKIIKNMFNIKAIWKSAFMKNNHKRFKRNVGHGFGSYDDSDLPIVAEKIIVGEPEDTYESRLQQWRNQYLFWWNHYHGWANAHPPQASYVDFRRGYVQYPTPETTTKSYVTPMTEEASKTSPEITTVTETPVTTETTLEVTTETTLTPPTTPCTIPGMTTNTPYEITTITETPIITTETTPEVTTETTPIPTTPCSIPGMTTYTPYEITTITETPITEAKETTTETTPIPPTTPCGIPGMTTNTPYEVTTITETPIITTETTPEVTTETTIPPTTPCGIPGMTTNTPYEITTITETPIITTETTPIPTTPCKVPGMTTITEEYPETTTVQPMTTICVSPEIEITTLPTETTSAYGITTPPYALDGIMGRRSDEIYDLAFEPFEHPLAYHRIRMYTPIELRTALRDPRRRWTDGIIPYELSSKYNTEQKNKILKAMSEFHNKTCVRFVKRTNEHYYIHIEPEQRCSSVVGISVRNVSRVLISDGCYDRGTLLHELMHVLGFVHEQNRPDRDQYILVMWDNIDKAQSSKPPIRNISDLRDRCLNIWYNLSPVIYQGLEASMPRRVEAVLRAKASQRNFRKYSTRLVTTQNSAYDYGSLMHYEAYAFAMDPNRPTLVPLKPGVKLESKSGFSRSDLDRINRLYGCHSQLGRTSIRN
ncbi:zinc metalloproteinase nas-15 [Nephila pilipes]|uniref:Metalloendopeptidase n=1 Tax=Nephila pilipes TaxID=299642 RepID=A0A8X6MSQ2_NEPPI|nr:zinc metalloproteinase nas-15 [Nephila pilipes]